MQPFEDPSIPVIRTTDFIIPDATAFINALDLENPSLADVRATSATSGPETALLAFVKYFRHKTIATPLLHNGPLRRFFGDVPRNPLFRTEQADRFLAGHLHDGYMSWDTADGILDWHKAPLPCITRFSMFSAMLAAAHHSQNPRYARWIIDHGRAYMDAWPIAGFAGHNTLENTRSDLVQYPWNWGMIHSRLRIWSSILQQLRSVPEVTDEEILTIIWRMIEETRYFLWHMPAHVSYKSNAGGTMLLSMAFIAAILDDFREAASWRAQTIALFVKYLDAAFYPDGVFKELTIGYGTEVALTMQQLALAFRDQPAIEHAIPRLRTIMTAIVGMSRPDRSLPPLGDSWATRIKSSILPAAAEWLAIPWADEARLASGATPPFTAWPPPGTAGWSGYYTMRSGWSDRDNYLLVDGGPWGLSHMHCDRLSIVASAHGRNFLVDPNKTTYRSNLPDACITMLNAGFQHNTITVDGVDEFIEPPGWWETGTPLDNRWECGDGYTLFCGRFNFRPVKEILWERRILFIGGAYWLLQDVLTGTPGEVMVEQNFQHDEHIGVRIEGSRSIATAPDGTRLLLAQYGNSLQPRVVIGDRNPHKTYSTYFYASTESRMSEVGRGWICHGDHKPIPAPAVVFSGRVRLPVILTTAIVPFGPAATDENSPSIRWSETPSATTWHLPIAGKTMTFLSTLENCSVLSNDSGSRNGF